MNSIPNHMVGSIDCLPKYILWGILYSMMRSYKQDSSLGKKGKLMRRENILLRRIKQKRLRTSIGKLCNQLNTLSMFHWPGLCNLDCTTHSLKKKYSWSILLGIVHMYLCLDQESTLYCIWYRPQCHRCTMRSCLDSWNMHFLPWYCHYRSLSKKILTNWS